MHGPATFGGYMMVRLQFDLIDFQQKWWRLDTAPQQPRQIPLCAMGIDNADPPVRNHNRLHPGACEGNAGQFGQVDTRVHASRGASMSDSTRPTLAVLITRSCLDIPAPFWSVERI
jgi:hypothetical protein